MQIDRIEETTDAQGNPECFVSGSIADPVTGDVYPFARWLTATEYASYQSGTPLALGLKGFSAQHLATMRKESGKESQVLRATLEQATAAQLTPTVDTEYWLQADGETYTQTVLADTAFLLPDGHTYIAEFPTGVLS